jgi:hypothetical protein
VSKHDVLFTDFFFKQILIYLYQIVKYIYQISTNYYLEDTF